MIIDYCILALKYQHMKTNRLLLSGRLIRILPLLVLMLVFVQCRGPRGYDGLDGINYTSTALYDINPSDWSGDADGFWVTIDVPEITDNIYYSGAVLVYRLIETAPKSFNMMPYSYVDNALTVYMDYDAYVGSIDILYKEIYDGANDTFAPEGLMTFKVVIIEGIQLAALKNMVDVSDFNAVSKLFNIDKSNSTVVVK
jgi:hypothetical protein